MPKACEGHSPAGERFDGDTIAAGDGISLCYGCHGTNYNGLTTRDYVLTPHPLQ